MLKETELFNLPGCGRRNYPNDLEIKDQSTALARRLYRMSDLFMGQAIIKICREAREIVPDLKGRPSSYSGCGLLAFYIGPEIGYRLIMRSKVSGLVSVDKKFMFNSMKDMGSALDLSKRMISMFGNPLFDEEMNMMTGSMALDGDKGVRAWVDQILKDAFYDSSQKTIIEKVFTNDPADGNIFVVAVSQLGHPPIIHNGQTSTRGWSADRIFEISRNRSKMGGRFSPGPIWSPVFQEFDRLKDYHLHQDLQF